MSDDLTPVERALGAYPHPDAVSQLIAATRDRLAEVLGWLDLATLASCTAETRAEFVASAGRAARMIEEQHRLTLRHRAKRLSPFELGRTAYEAADALRVAMTPHVAAKYSQSAPTASFAWDTLDTEARDRFIAAAEAVRKAIQDAET